MRKMGLNVLFWGMAIAIQGAVFFAIPSLGSNVFLSPDETAVAVSVRIFADTGTMRLEDALLDDVPWLHPRSYVAQGSGMVPVGFLGLPAILGILFLAFGEPILLLWSPLLALSVAYPLYRFFRPLGRAGQIAGVATWLSFPTVILYANRGLFPNLTVVCFAVWAAWLLFEKRTRERWAIAGLLTGAAFVVRPIEAVWLLPWIVCAVWYGEGGWKSIRRTDVFLFVAGAIPPVVLALFAAWKTYGSPFTVGYFLRDAPGGAVSASGAPVQDRAWPFGIHPRNVWFNIRTYLLGFLGPWAASAFVAMGAHVKSRRTYPIMILGFWTFVVGCAVYGQALYQDHVGVNVAAVGNSFLRYLLPLTPFFALGVGCCIRLISESKRLRYAAGCAAIAAFGIVWLGNWTAMRHDDEGLVASQNELRRYAVIREAVAEDLARTSVVLSDRSDKIFFPLFRTTSPMPSFDRIRDLVGGVSSEVFIFSTTLDENGINRWKREGIDLYPVFQSMNQSLYILGMIDATSTSP